MGARSVDAGPEVIDAVGRFGEHFGVTYQIIDDVLDVEGASDDVGKQTCRDLLEGKTTLPLTLAMKDGDQTLTALVEKARTGDAEAAARAARLPLVREACAEARRYGLKETEEGISYLKAVPACRERELLIDLSTSLVERRA
jgi:octaprenyl-diphosphate synthase